MNRDSIYLPRDVIGLLQTLQSAGHTAYVVGGCVRDSLLGRTPGDWDICTSARPEEMPRCGAVRGRPAQGPGPAGFYHQRHGLRPGQGHY